MTSGHFTSFPLDSIVVERDKRQRKELTGITELAWSLNSIGQINPLIITRDGILKAGERRLTAAKQLGWTHINVQFTDELDPAQLELLELEENVRRVDLTWQDQCLAIERYHQLRARDNPEWTGKMTAEALRLSEQDVSRRRNIAREIENGNTTVIEAPKFSVASGIVQRATERRVAAQLDTLTERVTNAPVVREAPLLNIDFDEWSASYVGPKFNFIHCDFPYGIDAGNHNQGAAPAFGGYEDSPEIYWKLLQTLERSMNNVVAESAHLMFWFSMQYYRETIDLLSAMGWKVLHLPLIWHKSDNSGILPDPSRGPRWIYETCLMASRGDRKIVRAVSNLVSAPNTKRIHMSEKPQAMLRKFMEMFVDESTAILDPTAGSGNALRAAEALGATRALGLEINTEFFNKAKETYYDIE